MKKQHVNWKTTRLANNPTRRCLLDLSDDLLTEIFKLLDMKGVTALRLASKALKRTASACISRISYPRDFPLVSITQASLELLLQSLPSLSEIGLEVSLPFQVELLDAKGVRTALHTLKVCRELPLIPAQYERIMSHVIQAPKLHTLILGRAFYQSPVRLDQVLPSCTSLRHLALDLSGVTIRDVEAVLAATHLTALRIQSGGIKANQEEGLAEAFGNGLSKLAELEELQMVPVMFTANPLSLTSLTKLRKLSIMGASDPEYLDVSGSFTALAGLQELVLEEAVCSDMLQAMLRPLTGLSRLEVWSGEVCSTDLAWFEVDGGFEDFGGMWTRMLELLLPRLRHLKVPLRPSPAPVAAEFLGALPSLQHLDVTWSSCPPELGAALGALTALTGLAISAWDRCGAPPGQRCHICSNRGSWPDYPALINEEATSVQPAQWESLSFLTAFKGLRSLSVSGPCMQDLGNVKFIAELTGLTRLAIDVFPAKFSHVQVQEFTQLASLHRLEEVFVFPDPEVVVDLLNGLRRSHGLPPIVRAESITL
eukprot:jgi/Botrbrau1/21861/Bobra.0190s0072.1